jgi:predicted regulator of Ras-like GTPase activity (Roadblock/LC7/MglB family)
MTQCGPSSICSFNLSNKATDLLRALTALKSSSPAVLEALIADDQGLPLVSTFNDQELESSLAALTAMMLSDSICSLREMSFGGLRNVVITGERGYLLFRGLGRAWGIAFMIDPKADWSSIIPEINWAVMEIHLIARTPIYPSSMDLSSECERS